MTGAAFGNTPTWVAERLVPRDALEQPGGIQDVV